MHETTPTDNPATEPENTSTDARNVSTPEAPAEQAPPARKPHPNKVAFNELQALYPDLFNLRQARPLKIGIHKSLAEDGQLSKTRIRRALNFYVRQLAYIRAVSRGGERFGLSGPDGQVTPEEQAHARERVQEIEEKRRANRKAAGRPARRPRREGGGLDKGRPGDKDTTSTTPTGNKGRPGASGKKGHKPPEASGRPAPAAPRKDTRDPETRMQDKLQNLAERFNQN